MAAIAGARAFQGDRHIQAPAGLPKRLRIRLPVFAIKINRQKEAGLVQQHRVNSHDEAAPRRIPAQQMPADDFFRDRIKSALDYAGDTLDPLYVFPADITPIPNFNLPSIVFTVRGQESKTIRYLKEWENYLIQPMKDIISYLKSFSSDGATRYQPDRLLVGFESEEGKRIPENAAIIPWPQDVTSPAHRSYMGVLYLEGTEALKLYKAAGERLYGYFSFEGKKYNVYLRPILPHECHIYHLYEETPPTQPYFTCDDW